MKLVKFLKNIYFSHNVEVYDKNDKMLYKGSVIPFHALAAKDDKYYDECIQSKNFNAADEYLEAKAIKDLKLDNGNSDYEAVSITKEINKRGVEIFVLQIFTK